MIKMIIFKHKKMPIKKTSLEQKWYYRIAKTFFLILPFVIIILLLLNRKTIVCSAPPASAVDWQKNISYILIFLVSYFLILTVVWKSFLYIIFGGVEDDTRKNNTNKGADETTQSAKSVETKSAEIVRLIPWIIIAIVFTIIALSEGGYITLPKINLDSMRNPDAKSNPVAPSVGNCPVKFNPPCNSVQNGVAMRGGPIPASCECPEGSYFSGTMDNITKGGPYKICVCK